MNNEPWFHGQGQKAEPELEAQEDETPQTADGDYSDDEVIRLGNNRKKVKGLEAKARRKMAKKSKQRNRK